MFWPGYLPDEFEYLRVVDYLVGGQRGGGGGRSNKRHLFSSTFRPPQNIFLQDSLNHRKNRIEFYQSRVFIAQYQEAITEKSSGST